VHAALVHYPVRDRAGATATSAITNVDVHDLARSCRTYGLSGYWVVSPIAAQRLLVDRILEHWRTGSGARRVPERTKALSICRPSESLDAVVGAVGEREGMAPEIWVTEARSHDEGRPTTSWGDARRLLSERTRPVLVLFGTAHGLHSSVLSRALVTVAPIEPEAEFNHLSVRAAAAVTFDRLLGAR